MIQLRELGDEGVDMEQFRFRGGVVRNDKELELCINGPCPGLYENDPARRMWPDKIGELGNRPNDE